MISLLILVFIIGLCWGSFLNVLAHRVLANKKLFTHSSYCPSCMHMIAWYDNIPLISWVVLQGKCRLCKAPISWLYPFTELSTAVVVTASFYTNILSYFPHVLNLSYDIDISSIFHLAPPVAYQSFFAYLLVLSALIVATRTDLEAMVIPQAFSIWLVPLGFIFSYVGLLEITLQSSILGAVLGYGLLWIVAYCFKFLTKKEGMGVGDMELLALIGSFFGPLGAWMSVMVGSFSGLLVGSVYLFINKQSRTTRIPFGPFLALGAIIYFFFSFQLCELFLR